MFTRKQQECEKKKLLSQRKLAPLLGVTYVHLNLVLNGHRRSRRLMKAYTEYRKKERKQLSANPILNH